KENTGPLLRTSCLIGIYLLIIRAMRRKPGSLVPLETAICEVASVLQQRGVTQFHGFSMAKELKHCGDTKLLTAYGTLYRALDRLEQMGFLRSEPEDPHS